MPQLRVLEPGGQAQMPTTSPAAIDAGIGNSLGVFAQGVDQLGQAVDQVGRFRGEQAALQADRELQDLEIELRSNPSRLLGSEWQEEFDDRVSVIQDKYSESSLMDKRTFGAKFGVLAGNRKMSIAAESIRYTLQAGSDAHEANMRNYQDQIATADTPEERAFYKKTIKDSAATAVAMGFRTPGEAEMDVKEAIENGIAARFNQLLFAERDVEGALSWISENDADLTEDTKGALAKLAFEMEAQNLTRKQSEYRYRLAVEREYRARLNDQGISEFIVAATGNGMSLEQAQQDIFPKLSPDNKKWLMAFYQKNPSGKLSFSATQDDDAFVIDVFATIRGQRPEDPDNPVPIRLLRAADEGRITANTYMSLMADYEDKEVDPVVDLVGKAMGTLMDGETEEEFNTASAESRIREWIRQNPGADDNQKREAALAIVKRFDQYGLVGVLEGGPRPRYFINDDSGQFSRTLSENYAMRLYENRELNTEELNQVFEKIKRFDQMLEAIEIVKPRTK